MSSFIAVYVQNGDEPSLLRAVTTWLESFGFDEAEPYESVPSCLQVVRLGKADAVGVERLNESWHMLLINAFKLGCLQFDETALQPLASQLGGRVVLFVAQTTSSVLQLAVFDEGACVRNFVTADGQVLQNVGAPLPGERRGAFSRLTDSDDEDSPSEMDDATTICSAFGFELWRTPPLQGPGYYWRRRGLIRKLLHR